MGEKLRSGLFVTVIGRKPSTKTKEALVKHHDEAAGEMGSKLPVAADVSGCTFCIFWGTFLGT